MRIAATVLHVVPNRLVGEHTPGLRGVIATLPQTH
jgi:hypothetical protein